MAAADIARPRRARVVHSVPGRVRIRVPDARGDGRLFQQVSQVLASVPGVHTVRTNPGAASAVVHYHPDAGDVERDLVQAALDSGLLAIEREFPAAWAELEAELPEISGAAQAILGLGGVLNHVTRASSAGVLDLKVLLPLLAGVLSLRTSAHPKQGTPIWVTLAIFAFNSFTAMHPSPSAPRAEGPSPPRGAGPGRRRLQPPIEALPAP